MAGLTERARLAASGGIDSRIAAPSRRAPVLHGVLGILALAGLVFCTVVAARWGIAAFVARDPVVDVSSSRLRATAFAQADRERADGALRRALGLDPNNPEYLNELGRVDMWRYVDREESGIADDTFVRFRRSAALRPTWPYLWINRALLKSARLEFDAEFTHALIRAAQTGPWEPPVQRAILHAGLANWPVLPAAARNTVKQTVRRALVTRPTWTLHLLARYRRADLLRDIELWRRDYLLNAGIPAK